MSGAVAIGQFAVAGIAALVVLALIGMAALRSAATKEAVLQAREIANLQTRHVVQPAITDALAAGDPAAVSEFDRIVRTHLSSDRQVRVKLWTADGTIVYSDDPRLIGERFALEADDREVLATGNATANLSDLAADENKLEHSYGQLLQVYERVLTPSGRPLLWEIYLRFDSITARADSIGGAVAPAFVLALLALEALQLPLAWRLVRRLRQGQREREVLQWRAMDASDAERRRIARDLHDGVVQQLAGVSFSLAALSKELQPAFAGSPEARATDRIGGADPHELTDRIDSAAAATRSGVMGLRTLISEIYPPNRDEAGLRAALGGLLEPLAEAGIATTLEMPSPRPLRPEVGDALFRAAQEALRNVAVHAGASHVRVTLDTTARRAVLTVTDDGIGFDPAVPPGDDRPHFGIRMLSDLASEANGQLKLTSAPGEGVTFMFELPLR
ncbi:MAG: two-component system, NarL family, sensor kinase [Cryptosporangiaceae bacterium]|nr:two-component system, NarL family, sensor kinase [Cryptosporangiaceae bacterium]